MLWTGALAAVGGIGVLRWSWSRERRSPPANIAGWGLLLAAVVAGAMGAGAWGVSVVALIAMGAASLLLGWAAATAPKRRSKGSSRRVRMLPDAGEPPRIGARLITFGLVIVLGLAASIALGIGLRGMALGIGWSEADANATALVVVPVAWGVLATIMLMLETRRAQLLALAATSLPLIPALIAGS